MTFVAEVFPRLVVMRAGRVILDGTPAEVFAEANWPTLATTYLDPPLSAREGVRLGLGSTPTEASLIDAGREGTRRGGRATRVRLGRADATGDRNGGFGERVAERGAVAVALAWRRVRSRDRHGLRGDG